MRLFGRSFTSLTRKARVFGRRLQRLRDQSPVDFAWYDYPILANVWHLEHLLDDRLGALLASLEGPIADVGAADGDLGFFLESLGHRVDLVDWPGTNRNEMRGARELARRLGSRCRVLAVDLERDFTLPEPRYGLTLMLGLLYHLKNPFHVLESLAAVSERLLLSTRIAAFTVAGKALHDAPLAYLLDASECNGDATNYWIFSEPGLRRLVQRAGFTIEAALTVGDQKHSDPSRPEHDQRAFLLLRSNR